MMVIAPRSRSHMPVSQTSATSARSSSTFALRKGTRLGLPDSSSPSNRIDTLAGSDAGDRLPGPAGLDEGHQLSLVVGGAAGDDPLRAVDRFDARLERRRLPLGQRVDRLDVVVTVEEDMRSARREPGRGRRPWDGPWSGGPRRRSRGRPVRPPASPPPRGRCRDRRDRWRCSRSEAERTAGRGSPAGRRRSVFSTRSSIANPHPLAKGRNLAGIGRRPEARACVCRAGRVTCGGTS